MNCPTCESNKTKKFGKDRHGAQRYRCTACGKAFQDPKVKPLDNMSLAEEKALRVISCLIEGCSVRSTERLTGVDRNTILRLLSIAGRKCEALMLDRIRELKVSDVQCDEVWSWVGMKNKTKIRKGETSNEIGDAWTFTAIESNSKLILAWHVGHRGYEDTVTFTDKIAHATSGSFQISTDGFPAYRDAVVMSLGMQRVDFAQLIKIYRSPVMDDTRYSPAECTGARKEAIMGNPDMDRCSTSHIERHNLSVRMENRRFTRLTNAFSKKWENHRAALALYFAYYNFCRMHKTLRCTPAMAAGVTKSVWDIKDLLKAAAKF
jgi:transposase-like protein/IS1 family transposase